jgi:hypothetical protein
MLLSLSNGKCFKLDVDAIVKYCTGTQDERSIQKDITELYKDGFDGLELVQRQINETKIQNGQIKTEDNIKYDTIKMLLENITSIGLRQGENGIFHKFANIEENISISETISWNTLISLGILIEIKNSEITL